MHLNRSLIVGVLGAVIVAAAIALTFNFNSEPDGSRVAEAPKKDAAGISGSDNAAAASGSAVRARKTKPEVLAAPEISTEPVRPKFDVVRVSPSGNAVIAGRAEPHSEVTVSDRDKEVGKVKADARGEWVLIPKNSFKAGAHELSLESRKPETKVKAKSKAQAKTTAKKIRDAAPVLSKENIVLVVPEIGKDIAGRKISGKSGALAFAVPRDGGGGSTVLQKPAMAREEIAAAPSEVKQPVTGAAERPAKAAEGSAKEPAIVGKVEPLAEKLVVAKVVERSAEELAAAQKRIERRAQKPTEIKTASIAPKPSKPGPTKPKALKPGSKLSLDAIDYNEAGKVELSGRAPTGSRVQVYLDNKPVAAAEAGKSGEWRIKPVETVPPGLYKLRVDQINKSGNVIARVELPFARAKPLGKLPRDAVVFVQPGNSLWRIARNTYGQGLRYAVIYEANRDQIRNPHLIYPGQIFHLPKVN